MECEGCRWYRVEFEEVTRYPNGDAEGYGRVPVCQAPQNDDGDIRHGECPWRKEWNR